MDQGKKTKVAEMNSPERVPSRKDLYEMIKYLAGENQKLREATSNVLNNVSTVVRDLTLDSANLITYSESKYDDEYLKENVGHMFKDLYYDIKEETYMYLEPITKGWDVVADEEGKVFTFNKDDKTHVVEAPDRIKAEAAFRTKLRAEIYPPKTKEDVTKSEGATLEVVSD